jgi:hypothetical protein
MVLRTFAVFGILGAIALGCSGDSTSAGTANVSATGANAGMTGSVNGSAGSAGATGATGGATVSTGTTNGNAGSTQGATGTSAAGTSGSSGTNGGTAGDDGGNVGTTGASATGGTSGTGMAATDSGTGGAEGGTTGAGGRQSGPSAGCNMAPPATQPIGQAVLHMIDITGMAQQYVAMYTHRKFCLTIPKNYDQTKPYPVVFYGPGCGATTCEGSSFTSRTDIIYVEAISVSGCFQAGRQSTVDSPELNYFDQVMAETYANYCVDKGKIFASGTSSGGWLSNYLGCARGNVIRAIAADSGGIPVAHPMCTGGAAAMEFPGDSANLTDTAGNPIGVSVARDLFIKLNGCSTTPTNMMFGTASCQFYGNCSSPVVWCNTGGAHQAGNNYLSPSGWAFWSTLN